MQKYLKILLSVAFVAPAFGAFGQGFWKSLTEQQVAISIEGNTCVGDSVFFSHDVLNSQYNYWNFGDSVDSYKPDPVHIYNEPDDYTVSLVVTMQDGSKDSTSTTLEIGTPPNLVLEYGDADADWEIYEGQETTITAKGDFETETIKWFKGSQLLLKNSRTVNVDQEGVYTAVAADENGCSVTKQTDSLVIKPPLDENDNLIEVVNNIMTPNGDGFNDFLIIKDKADYANPILISIYNVWGDKVYENANYKGEQWKAEGLDAGTYYYHIRSEGKQGITGFIDVIK